MIELVTTGGVVEPDATGQPGIIAEPVTTVLLITGRVVTGIGAAGKVETGRETANISCCIEG